MGNLFALRSTDPSKLYDPSVDPVGPDNDYWLKKLQSEAKVVICAWGDIGRFMGRDKGVLKFFQNPNCLVKLKSGRPGHPLYKSANLLPIPLFENSTKV